MNRSGVSGIKRSANKDLDALDDRTYIRIDRNIQRLINDPFSRGVKKLTDEENRYRIRVGKYQILFEINQKNWDSSRMMRYTEALCG